VPKIKHLPIGYTVRGIIERAGGPAKLATELKISYQSVYNWKTIPSKHATKIAILAGLPLKIVRPSMVQDV
jgi:hypothetical protein